MIVYRIRSAYNGLYSDGGTSVTWSKKGKIWKGIGPLKLHFNQLDRFGNEQYRTHQAIVVEVEISEVEIKSTDAQKWIDDVGLRKKVREDLEKAQQEERLRKFREREYTKLHAEFGNNK